MKASLLSLAIVCATAGFSSHAVAADIDINKLQQLINRGDSQSAYQYASEYRERYEGDPNFDYFYGMAAIDSGRASEGVFALERVVMLQPDNNAARLELARGYFILEEYARSRQEFETVLGYQPPPSVRAKIDNYLAAIKLREGRYNTTTSSFVELGYGSDSNVNSGPESANAFLQYLGFNLFGTDSVSPSSLETDDTFIDATANFSIQSPVTATTSLFGSVTANLRSHNEASEFDTTTLTAKGGVQYRKASDIWRANLTLQKFNLDGNDYRDLVGFNTSWKRQLTQMTTVNAALQYAASDFAGQDYRNANTLTLSGGISSRFNIALTPVAYANLYLANDAAQEDSSNAEAKTERDYYGLRLGAVLNTSARTSTHVALSYQQSEYGAPDASLVTPVVREDNYSNALIDFSWLFAKNWKLNAQFSSTRNTSTLDTSDYSRQQLMLSVRYDIQ